MRVLLTVVSIIVLFNGYVFGVVTSFSDDIFNKSLIEYFPDSTQLKSANEIIKSDNGREINRIYKTNNIENYRITAHLEIHPIPKDNLSVNDPWDRAGNIRIKTKDGEEIEMIKFVTAYGGHTSYDVDITHLKPLFEDTVTIIAFIDTWVKDAWKVDLTFDYEPFHVSADLEKENPDWIAPVAYIPSYATEKIDEKGIEKEIVIPEALKRVLLYYYVSGHCTDGRDADEFISKDNIIYVDDVPVYRFQPWRDDCQKFRAINPYTKRWSDGYWSSDYHRSGWCPGDIVEPLILDLSDHLTPGKHSIRMKVENVRPKDENNHYGYWRISSHLVGYDNWDINKYNEE